MTPYLKLRQFVRALKLQQTRITISLEKTANDRNVRKEHGDDVRRRRNFDGPVVAWLRELMIKNGAHPEDFAHIDHFNDDAKEDARRAIAKAFEANKTVRFLWDMGDSEHVEISENAKGETVILIVSDRNGLRVTRDGIVYDVSAPRARRTRRAPKRTAGRAPARASKRTAKRAPPRARR